MASATDPLGWGRRLRSARVKALGVRRKEEEDREEEGGMEAREGRELMPK